MNYLFGPWKIEDSKTLHDFNIVPHYQNRLIKPTKERPTINYYPIASVSRAFLKQDLSKDRKERVHFEHIKYPVGVDIGNARLIAAAPEMFELLISIKDNKNISVALHEQVSVLINKITQQSP